MMNHALTLRTIAGCIEDGVPAPLGINLSDAGVSVQVQIDHLDAWLGLLDVPEPTWRVDADTGYSRASWPAGSFEGLPFALICVTVSDRELIEVLWRATS